MRDLQSRERWSEGTISIIYVEISGHELRNVWRRSKLKNKIWHSGHNRHIDKLDISLRPSKSTPFDVLRDVIVQTFLFVIRPDLGFYKLEPKLVNVTNLNRKLLKWTEFYVLMRILFFKNFTWFMESKDWSGFGYFSPDLEKIKQLLVCSKHQNTWEDTGNVVKVFF